MTPLAKNGQCSYMYGKIKLPRIKGKPLYKQDSNIFKNCQPLQDSYNICNLELVVQYLIRLKHFSSRAMAAPLISGVEPFVKLW